MLELERINTFRGAAHVLNGVSLRVRDGEAVVLVGRNGAGKTTTIDSIMGLLPVRSGRIMFNGEDISRLPAHRRALVGIGYSPEDAGIFPDLTVTENFQISQSLARAAGKAVPTAGDSGIDERVLTLFPEVRAFTNRRGLFLSGGQKKMVAIAAVTQIKAMGVSLLIAESNLMTASRVADRLYAIDRGEIIFDGPPRQAFENVEVMKTLRG